MNAYLCLLVYIVNVGAYCWIRTYKRRCVLSNTHLRLKGGNQLFENNVNTVDLYQISRVILSSFLGIPSEFLGNRWQYYSRHLQKIHCILSIYRAWFHFYHPSDYISSVVVIFWKFPSLMIFNLYRRCYKPEATDATIKRNNVLPVNQTDGAIL